MRLGGGYTILSRVGTRMIDLCIISTSLRPSLDLVLNLSRLLLV